MAHNKNSHVGQQNIRQDIGKVILTVLSVAGVLAIALVAPNALQVLIPRKGRQGQRVSAWEIERALKRLLNGGYAEKQLHQGNTFVRITTKGNYKLNKLKLRDAHIKTPAKWDRKWRLVFFDIPHTKGSQRDIIRRKLKELGFLQVQKSVYLHPYECYDIIQNMQNFYQIKSYFHYAVVEKIEGGHKYLSHFKLKKPA
ncbi:MAG: Transcriptional regulator, PaaX family [Parcubacteria group bacterium GW2011_GWA2_46_9]|nr:MAG: Transcriptional regulator, PaaX family [Parcubacteria group bacterium GW2011_GWA2_46_9]